MSSKCECGKIKTAENTLIIRRKGSEYFYTRCRECANARSRAYNRAAPKKKLETIEQFSAYVRRIKYRQITESDEAMERKRPIETHPVWNDEELRMIEKARVANDPSMYLDYIQSKVNKEL